MPFARGSLVVNHRDVIATLRIERQPAPTPTRIPWVRINCHRLEHRLCKTVPATMSNDPVARRCRKYPAS